MAPRVTATAILLVVALPLGAQALSDPTRPATAQRQPVGAEEAEAPRLQSVLISAGRKVAVIDGRTVQEGDLVGDAKVLAISPAAVILQKGAQRQTLKLLPGVEKKP